MDTAGVWIAAPAVSGVTLRALGGLDALYVRSSYAPAKMDFGFVEPPEKLAPVPVFGFDGCGNPTDEVFVSRSVREKYVALFGTCCGRHSQLPSRIRVEISVSSSRLPSPTRGKTAPRATKRITKRVAWQVRGKQQARRSPGTAPHLLSALAPARNLSLFCVLRKEQLERTAEEPALRNHGALGQLSELGGKLRRAEKGNLGLVGFAWCH